MVFEYVLLFSFSDSLCFVSSVGSARSQFHTPCKFGVVPPKPRILGLGLEIQFSYDNN
jgi:hypothetical protein